MATKKKLLKEMRARAAEVPQVNINVTEKHYVKGADLIAQGEDFINDNGALVKVDPEKMYPQRMPVILAVNHARRMRKIYKKAGNEGVLAYYDAVDQHLEKTPPPREVARALSNIPPR